MKLCLATYSCTHAIRASRTAQHLRQTEPLLAPAGCLRLPALLTPHPERIFRRRSVQRKVLEMPAGRVFSAVRYLEKAITVNSSFPRTMIASIRIDDELPIFTDLFMSIIPKFPNNSARFITSCRPLRLELLSILEVRRT